MAKVTLEPKVNDYQNQVIKDRDARTNELKELDAFIESEPFKLIGDKSQTLLQRQSAIMHDLVGVLNARIALFV